MSKMLMRLGLLIGVPFLTWLGFVQGVDGALYVVKFFVWAMCLPIGLMALTTTMQQHLAKEPEQAAAMKLASRVVAWSLLAMMVWTGHIVTATAWGFYMLCAAVCSEGAKRHRAALSAAPAA